MVIKSLRALALLLALSCAVTGALGREAGKRNCQLGYDNSIFVPKAWPERSLEEFAQGRLGVVDPRFDHFYLFIAYRALSGRPLTTAQVDQLRPFDPCWDDGSNGYFGKDWSASPIMLSAQAEWQAARTGPGLPAVAARKAQAARSTMGYTQASIPNCNPDSYRTAARTLKARLASHGASPWVRTWAMGQDAVFGQCFDASVAFPEAAADDAPAWFRADRAYQLASVHFYAGQYAVAAGEFTAIAADTDSPWKPWGRYLAARAHLRQGSSSVAQENAPSSIWKARQLLEASLADPLDASVHADAGRMLQRVRLRLEPTQVFQEIDARLSASTLPESLGQDVRDFDPQRAGEVVARDGATFAGWLHVMRQGAAARRVGGGPLQDAWLVAALQSAQPGLGAGDPLMRQAAAVPATSPAFQTVQYHRVRLLSDRHAALDIARRMIALPAAGLSEHERNRFKALALPMAQSRAEFGSLVHAKPVSTAETEQLRKFAGIPVVDADGGALLNRAMPLDSLYALYLDTVTPAAVRRELLSVVWVRALVLSRWDVLRRLTPDMRKWLPGDANSLERIARTTDTGEMRAGAAAFLLRHPGMVGSVSTSFTYGYLEKPLALAPPNMRRSAMQDGERENWWCTLPSGGYLDAVPLPAPPPLPAFLGANERAAWAAEYAVLKSTPNATEYLGRIVLDWAGKHPRDAILPEALRMIVRSSRGGCVTSGADLGRTAFRHLHRHFPASEAARLTRTWG